MKTVTKIRLAALSLALFAAPAWSELCLDPDGVYRTCVGTYERHGAINTDWAERAAVAERAQRQAELDAWRQDQEDERAARSADLDRRLDEIREDSRADRVDIERKYNRALRSKSEVEQQIYLRDKVGFEEEDIKRAYDR